MINFAAAQENVILPLVCTLGSWQVEFFIVGLPGLLVALLLLTIREPVRQGTRKKAPAGVPPAVAVPPLREVWACISGIHATFTSLYVGVAMAALGIYGAMAWIPPIIHSAPRLDGG